MGKRRKAAASSNSAVIEGVVRHSCGWVSDGGAFVVGAGCPNCGERITADSIEEVTADEAEENGEKDEG